MSVGERDPHTGHMTTGHEWNGIKELNTPVPRVVWFFLIVTALWSLAYWILMPAWPLGVTYTKGLLGFDDREVLEERIAESSAARAEWVNAIASSDYDAIRKNPALMTYVRDAGHALFTDNCAVCHGTGGTGGKGYPDLTANAWLWGGEPETIAETLRVGINSTHDETRFGEMMAFGRDGMIDRDDVLAVTDYVRSLSNPDVAEDLDDQTLEKGRDVFTQQCATCHGDDGTGIQDMGAPNLADGQWIYGGDRQSVYQTIYHGRRGHMPHWEGRLGETERRILTLYVLDLANGEP